MGTNSTGCTEWERDFDTRTEQPAKSLTMPPKADEPLRKVTLNLYDADCAALETYYGRGWSEQVRALVRDHTFKLTAYANVKQTLGDLG